MIVRNLIGLVGAAALYVAVLLVVQLFEPKGRDALLLLFGLHVGFGILGYFVFVGSTFIRAICVLLVVLGFGVATEFLSPDPRHELTQVFVAFAFGVLAGVSTGGGRLLAATRFRSRTTEKA